MKKNDKRYREMKCNRMTYAELWNFVVITPVMRYSIYYGSIVILSQENNYLEFSSDKNNTRY